MGKRVNKEAEQNANEFARRLRAETATLKQWQSENRITGGADKIGFELEMCIVDGGGMTAAPISREFLRGLDDPHLTIEVGKHNIEFNPPPMPVARAAGIAATLADALRRASARAQTFNAAVISVGLLPTLTPADFTVAMMTDSERVALLLARLRELKGGGDNVFAVNIGAGEGLYIAVNSAVLESATTSFQIHLQVPVQNAANYYNAAQLIAAPLISASANSPFFMGRRLWEETRVPVFEQILYERFTHEGGKRKRRDDFFGAQYLNHSLTEIYEQNLRLPVLLPVLSEDGAHLPHLSLHNSTVWRWNRPVLGFDDNGAPTLRIEHRGLPAGPTAADMAADAALFIGAVCALSKNLNLADAPPFAKTRDNFYAAARDGLRADLHWFNGKVINAAELITKNILPLAKKGLQTLGAEEDEINTIAEVILRRAESGQNGAQWQKDFIAKYGGGSTGMARMTRAYWQNQQEGKPVNQWKV